ncbi:hypothetical protein MTX26_15905 [Bradyrhizobium sp. ISRA443]|uniref:hypothetical protein n=1 Tax=unclassified Bradyrhizobium TaxID=2631580 RepID=UPI0024792A2A|nr:MULTISPECIES: hypothetical protein [unclassified Bradyrhizobium]WGS02212.1 hypothetical protein MTX23_15915 [Bradyrhizobium sp. ISRA436]WGS09097.1 hypothetical protein MTX18_15905 [Bradyrhizobium sp. ISRA437]WGS15986.1 hypothetical protein MTX26_15905 [Bradyrhizobium sp. ISRA443]
MNKIVSTAAIAAALPVATPSIAAVTEADPIFAALEVFRDADRACVSQVGEDVPDEAADRLGAATRRVMRTRPSTPAGLSALTAWVRNEVDDMHANGSVWKSQDLAALAATIDDAVRGMSGLHPWSPPVGPAEPMLQDRALIDAAQALAACYQAVNKMLGDLGEEAEETDEYAALLDRCNANIASLIERPATSKEGYRAKASALQLQDLIGDYRQHQQVAVSLADDLTGMCSVPQLDREVPAASRPDAKLLELGQELERLLAFERPLSEESSRLHKLTDRVRYEKMGIDPDDENACYFAARARWKEWSKAWDPASDETGYSKAFANFSRARRRTARVVEKIFEIPALTLAGLLVRVRAIEVCDEVLDFEPDQSLLAEIRDFARRAA